MEHIGSALVITVIGMAVIFTVLILLMGTIVALNTAFPYKEAPSQPAAATDGTETETVAVIQAAITSYLSRKKGKD